jgi:hypothetical protein
MRTFRTRLLVASVVSAASFACSDGPESALGPTETDLEPVTVSEPAFSVTAGDVESCLDTWEIDGTEPGTASPCDAAHGTNGYPGVYFMSNLVSNPNVSGELLSGLANDLIFEVVPFDCSGKGCETTRLQVREKGGVYASSWSVNKKDSHLAETNWRVRVSLDTGNGNDPVPLAYRDVFLTNSPSTDQPSDGPTLDIQFGSTQAIKVFVEQSACTNLEQGTTVSCLIGDQGGSLGLITPTGQQVEVVIGSGNGTRSYTLASNPGAVNADVRFIGDAVTVIANPPFGATERLNGSEIRFCEPSEFNTSGNNDAFVIQQDEHGQSVLPGLDVSCPLFSTSVGWLDGIGDSFAPLAALFAPRPLVATMFKAGSGGGGTLQRLSDFQLAEMSSAAIESGGGPQTITEGDTIDASVRVRVADGAAAAGATIHFYAQDGDLLECSDGTNATSCTELTGADGLASVGWIPVAGSRSLYALGCGIAVAGESTPQTPTDGILGVLQSSNGGICDRDTSVVDGYDSSVDGYANGAIAATVDPFEPYSDTEIALNDLPLVFTANVETFCDNVGETTVTCEFTDQNGGTLTIDDGTTGVQLNIGPGNGDRVYTLAFAENAVDVDVRTFGAAVSVTADPPLEADLLASTVLFCKEYDTSGTNGAYVIQQDADGQSVLPLLEVECPLVDPEVAVLDRIGEGVFAAASWFAPRPLVATAAFGKGSGGGGTLQRLSDFDLAEMSSASIESGDGQSITEGETIDASVKVEVADGSAATGATIRFFAEDGDVLECSDGTTGTSCVETTGTDGLATVGWTPALGDHTLYALGCGIAVAGESTPQSATDGILGVLQSSPGGICDRDPSVVDGYDSSADGYANGAVDGSVDPFEPFNDTEIALNDLPLVFTATVVEACDNTGETTVTCSFTDEEGGSLTIGDGTTEVQLNIGPGNGDRAYTLAFNDNAVDVDVRTYGRAVSVTADPPFADSDRLLASNVLFCRSFDTSGGNDAYVIQQDANGQSVLPLLAEGTDPGDDFTCPLVPAAVSVLDQIGEGLYAAASWLVPQPLVATAPFKAGSGGGGTLQRLSDFDLAEMSSASIHAGGSQTIKEGQTIDARVKVEVADGSAATGATIRFFAEAGDVLECSDGTTGTSCVETTGTDGLASVGWTPALGDHTLYALGCGIAVAGESTPQAPTDGILGVLQSSNGGICDRDPSVVDGYGSSVDGYANGAGAGVDPFEPFNDTEIALNDLPLVFTATVEEPYQLIDGRSGATDGFGARYKSFGNTGNRELWLGVSDLESVADRVETDLEWTRDSPMGNAISLSYDPAGAVGGQLVASVLPGGDTNLVSLTYDDVAGNAPASCSAADVDVLVVEIVGRHKQTLIDLRNVVVNGIPIEPSDFVGTRGTFNWTIAGFDVTSAFTVTGDLYLSGEFPPNGDSLTKLQISAACLP